MACDPNKNTIFDYLFSSGNDEFNWVTNAEAPIETIGGQLRLIPNAITNTFSRGLGALDPTNNRIRLKCNMEVFRPQASPDSTFCAVFGVYLGSSLIDQFTVYIDDIGSGDRIEYHLDRLYYYEDLSGSISLKISTPEGINNQLFLDYLEVNDEFYCDDNVRNYFAFPDLLELFKNSVSSAFQLLEWKIADVETLTPLFFSENNSPGGDPTTDWNFAKAELDGSERNAELVDYNTFNPFVTEFGLDFFDGPGEHLGGKPLSTTSGSDYGQGIMQLGFDKPTVLNRDLLPIPGVFFIDIDFTQNLLVSFDILINNTDANPFNSPDVHRRYFILWNADTKCAKSFYYRDKLDNDLFYDENINGFLSGLTGYDSTETTIACGQSLTHDGNGGEFSFVVDFGAALGQSGINYNAYDVPMKFEIDWNGVTYSSGYVGSNAYDTQLLNLGIPPSQINTGNPSTGEGSLFFEKTLASPSNALVRITAPLGSAHWDVTSVCPTAGQGSFVEIANTTCGQRPTTWIPVYIDESNPSSYVPQNGDIVYSNQGLTTPYDGQDKTYMMRVTNPPFQTIIDYQFTISAAGVIGNVFACLLGGSKIQIVSSTSSNCASCWSIFIEIPDTITRRVKIISSFAASGVYASGYCSGEYAEISSDVNELITESKGYMFGIDGANSGGTLSESIITVILEDTGGQVLNQKDFTRNHAPINC